jgi:hypothetical protein
MLLLRFKKGDQQDHMDIMGELRYVSHGSKLGKHFKFRTVCFRICYSRLLLVKTQEAVLGRDCKVSCWIRVFARGCISSRFRVAVTSRLVFQRLHRKYRKWQQLLWRRVFWLLRCHSGKVFLYYLDWNTGVYFQSFSGFSATSFPNMESM